MLLFGAETGGYTPFSRIPFFFAISTSCSDHCCHRPHHRIYRQSNSWQHYPLLGSSLLIIASVVLNSLVQATVFVRKVSLPPANVALAPTSAPLVGGGISRLFDLLRAPPFSSVVACNSTTKKSSYPRIVWEVSFSSPCHDLPWWCLPMPIETLNPVAV